MKPQQIPTPEQVVSAEEQREQLVAEAMTEFGGLPSGTIVMWGKPLAEIPAGFVFCDGTNGTLDLRGYALVGVQTGEDPGGIFEA